MKYYNYVKIKSFYISKWFYEWYSWYVVEQNEDKYKIYVQYHPEIDFEHFISWWIPESSLELIK